ncbi:MAG: hypothetical protein BWK72_12240 [Rhodoferax ferrireducens]|uniref:DUF4391 domain-containing protein n=1 Tax=Rhodoferax ferrireducens TaxID=192843 RepID=A0A1W9KTI3_9BURK|nr:MAG: hypothetical protein BWK72_12240 [Rhodoferax ferrireducens]
MTVDDFVTALGLPASCRVDQRVPKKMLIENGAPTAADKRLINDRIEEIQWLAALKPNTIGVPAYSDDVRDYLEIAVLCITLRGEPMNAANLARLAELVHRAVPYPVLLLLDAPHALSVSLAHKRWAQNEAGKVVLDGEVMTTALDVKTSEAPVAESSDPVATAQSIHAAFMQAVALRHQPQANLMDVYQGWMACLLALQVARYTSTFKHEIGLQTILNKREQLQTIERLAADATSLRSQATKARQLAQQVDLNLALQRVQAQLSQARSQLSN